MNCCHCQCQPMCKTPCSCQMEQQCGSQCNCHQRPCTSCAGCTSPGHQCSGSGWQCNSEGVYCYPMDFGSMAQIPAHGCHANMSCMKMQPRMQQYGGGCKMPNAGISLNTINSPTRFNPESMCLPGQPVCPMKDGGIPRMPGRGPADSSPPSCRPRCMQYM